MAFGHDPLIQPPKKQTCAADLSDNVDRLQTAFGAVDPVSFMPLENSANMNNNTRACSRNKGVTRIYDK